MMILKRENFCSYLSPAKVSCNNKPTVRFRYPDYAEGWWSYRCEKHAELLKVAIEPLIQPCPSKFDVAGSTLVFECIRPKDHDGYHGDGRAVWGFPTPDTKRSGCF